MKVVFPKNIKKGIIAGMTFNLGPLSLSIVQLFVVAIGVAAGVGVFSVAQKSGSKALAVMFAVPVIAFFLILAFFKVSELGLLALLAKKIRTNFFDTPIKYQVNYAKINPFQILIKSLSVNSQKEKSIEHKAQTNINTELLDRIESGGLL